MNFLNTINLLNNLPTLILLVTTEILKEAARSGKTPAELLDAAGIQTNSNEATAQELLNRLQLNNTMTK
jgi:urease gamma subunit